MLLMRTRINDRRMDIYSTRRTLDQDGVQTYGDMFLEFIKQVHRESRATKVGEGLRHYQTKQAT